MRLGSADVREDGSRERDRRPQHPGIRPGRVRGGVVTAGGGPPAGVTALALDRLEKTAFGESGTVELLVVSPRPGEHRIVDEIHVIPGVGVLGDHDGKQVWRGARVPGREISAINAEVLEALGIPPAAPGDNLIIRGIDLRAIPPGMILLIGDLPVRRTAAAHRPCRLFRDRTSGIAFQIAARGWRGALFDALTKGTIRAGDPVRFEV